LSAIRLFADECCPARLVYALRFIGFDVEYVIEATTGLADIDHARTAYARGRILLSADYDFGDLAIRDAEPFVGLILLSPKLVLVQPEDFNAIACRVRDLGPSLSRSLTVIEKDGFRQRVLRTQP